MRVGDRVGVGSALVRVVEKECELVDLSVPTRHWSAEVKNSIRQKLIGANVAANQELLKGIRVPQEGVVMDINEFMVAKIETALTHEKVHYSPVEAEVKEISETSLSLGFEAVELMVRGIIPGKAWGKGRFSIFSALVDITSAVKGQIVFMNSFNRGMVIKAEVLEAAGVVVKEEGKEVNAEELQIPIAAIDPATFQLAQERWGKETESRMLLNSKADRLLVVVQ